MNAATATIFIMCCLGVVGCKHEVNLSDKPNILLILTDDMGYGDVSNIGNPSIRTPHLDKLAAQGVRFDNFYVSPVCAPTRASLLTGRYHQRTGVRSVTNGFETIDPSEITLAEILKDNGYRTGIFGKWHLGEYYPSVPNAQGFDEYLGFRTGHTNYYYEATLEHNGKPSKTQGHITDLLTEKALDFMTSGKEDPFFCLLAYNAPHTPLQVDSSWWEPYSNQGFQERESRVYGMIEQLDHKIGEILDALKNQMMLENTMVIFMSDNGPINGWQVPQEEMRYNAGLRDQKFTVYEGGIRTQCYWLWGDKWPSGSRRPIAAHIDVLPTLLDYLEIATVLPPIDGVSLRPALEKESYANPNRIFFQKFSLETLRNPAPFPGGIARKGPWKMVNGKELYHLEHDVGEQIDLSEQHPGILSNLTTAYYEWYADITEDHQFEMTPIKLGFPEENPVYLQPHHGKTSGQVKFWGNRGITGESRGTHPRGVDSDWTGGWKNEGDALEWAVSMADSGRYAFEIIARDTTAYPIKGLSLMVNGVTTNDLPIAIDLSAAWTMLELGWSQLPKGPCSLKLTLEANTKGSLEVRALVVYKE